MTRYRLARSAQADIEKILLQSQDRFGDITRSRYSALFVQAMRDVAADPGQAVVEWKRLSGLDIGIYRLVNSRHRVANPPGRVRTPRHALVFHVAEDGVVDILGVIHDRMLHRRALRRIVRETGGSA